MNEEKKNSDAYKRAFLVQRLQSLRVDYQAIQWQLHQMKREEEEILEVLVRFEEEEKEGKEEKGCNCKKESLLCKV